MKRFLIIYFCTLIVLVPLDFLFIGTIGKKLFADHLGDVMLATPRMAPAILFYILYIAGVVVFVNGATPSDWLHNLGYGALFGLFCYATYELTSMALMKPWSWSIVVTDMAWGAGLTAASAAAAGLIANWLLARF